MSESKQPSEENRFYDNMDDLIRVIGEVVASLKEKGHEIINPAFIKAAEVILKSFDKEKLIQSFISMSYTHWDLIKKKDRKYFVKHAQSIFSGVKMENISAFSKMFEEDKDGKILIDKEDEDCIGGYFDSFVRISIKYIHRIRKPAKNKDGSFSYTAKGFEQIDLPKAAKTWELVLSV